MEVETKQKHSPSILRNGSFVFFANATVVKLSTRWIVSTSGGGFGSDLHICNRETSKLYGSTCLRALSMVQYGSKTPNGIDRLTEWSSHEVLYPTGSSNVAIQSRQEVLIHPPSNYTYIYLSVYICLCIYIYI